MRWIPALLASSAIVRADPTFDVAQIDERDYAPLSQVCAHFGFGPPMAAGPKRLMARAAGRSLGVEVDSREAWIDGVKHWLSYPARGAAGRVWIALDDFAHTVRPALDAGAAGEFGRVRTVILDPGHGGHDKGASSPLGLEKDYALDVALRVRRHLVLGGLRARFTRVDDRFIELGSRAALANKHPDSIFVSIHFNAAGWRPAARGVETYAITPRGAPPTGQEPHARDGRGAPGHASEPQSFVLANAIQHALIGSSGSEDRGVKRARFHVLCIAQGPSALVECGFLTNPGEAADADDPEWRERIAAAIAAGILEFAAFANGGDPPKRAADY